MTRSPAAPASLVLPALLAFVFTVLAEEPAFARLSGGGRDVAYAIYRWARHSINYIGVSDKSDWVRGAHQAFSPCRSDCFVYFAACKALLTAAGIENVDIVKSDTSHSRHYWLLVRLGGGWYHFDATPRAGQGDNFFLVTDAELEAYSASHGNSHVFDPSLYPPQAERSLQDMVDYDSEMLKR